MKKYLSNMSLQLKLVVLVVSISIFSILITSLLSSQLLERALTRSSESQVSSISNIISLNLKDSLDGAKSLAGKLARNRLVEGLFLAYESAFYGAALFPGEDLNANTEQYRELEAVYHERFNSLVKDMNFENVFLVSNAAQVILSSRKDEKGHYLGRNLLAGALSKTNLKQCYEKALASETGKVQFTGFFKGPYNTSSFFCVKQIAEFDHLSEGIKKGDLMGVVVAEYSHHELNKLTRLGNALGETSETVIIGQDNLLRSDSRLRKNLTVQKSFASKSGYDDYTFNQVAEEKPNFIVTKNGLGDEVLRYVETVQALGLSYSVLVEKNKNEILTPVKTINRYALLGALVTFFIAGLIGFFISRIISNRITSQNVSLSNITNLIKVNSQESLSDSGELSISSESMASAISQSSASMHELTMMIKRTLDSARNSEKYSSQTGVVIEEGLKGISSLLSSIKEIQRTNTLFFEDFKEMNKDLISMKDLINQVSKKSEVINDIVFQTKLLSFNASVEASRAGEHGKGFAVVAEEIGVLAEGSGQAAVEITKMLTEGSKEVEKVVTSISDTISRSSKEFEERVESGVSSAIDCEQNFKTIESNVKILENCIVEISNAANEQDLGIQEISQAMANLNTIAKTTSEIAIKSNKSSKGLLKNSQSLAEVQNDLSSLVDGKKV